MEGSEVDLEPRYILRDDPDIDDEDILWRAISPKSCNMNGAVPELTSQGFQDHSDWKVYGYSGPCASIGVERLIVAEGQLSAEDTFLKRFAPNFGIATIRAGVARGLGVNVVPAYEQFAMIVPEPDPWHGVIWVAGGRTKGQRRDLAGAAAWLRTPRSFSVEPPPS